MPVSWDRGEFTITTDPGRLDLDVIHGYLVGSYWSPGVARTVVERAIQHSLPFGIFHGDKQVGFGRVISDFATHAYIADVFVVPEYQGKGLGKWLVESMLAHPELQGLRSWNLRTRDAHGLYRQFGFETPPEPTRYMQRRG
jgi:GNAT superfamily N-acetyltransferase